MTLESGDVFTAHVDGNVLVLQAITPESGDEVMSACLPASEVSQMIYATDGDLNCTLGLSSLTVKYTGNCLLEFDDVSVTFTWYEWKLFIEAIKSQAWRLLQ